MDLITYNTLFKLSRRPLKPRNMIYIVTAYDIAVKHGFEGTEEEWLASLMPTNDYNVLTNKPSFEGEVLEGEKYLDRMSNDDIDALFT